MRKGMRGMSAVILATKKVINSPQQNITKEEAKEILIQCGILTKDNKIKKVYSNIVIEKGKDNNGNEP